MDKVSEIQSGTFAVASTVDTVEKKAVFRSCESSFTPSGVQVYSSPFWLMATNNSATSQREGMRSRSLNAEINPQAFWVVTS